MEINLFCIIIGDNLPFFITVSSTLLILEVKDLIKDEATDLLQGVDACTLTLWRPKDIIHGNSFEAFVHQAGANLSQFAYELSHYDLVQNAFQDQIQTPTQNLHILVEIPATERIVSSLVREYENIFIKVKSWRGFEDYDIERNGLRLFVEGKETAPNFVTEFEQNLDAKPGLEGDATDVFKTIRDVEVQNAYLNLGTDPHRLAGFREVLHLAYIVSGDFHQSWEWNSLNEETMEAIFFWYFAFVAGPTVQRGSQSWPFNLITKCANVSTEERLRKFQPHSDLLILKSNVPRLFVKVNSKPREERPEDYIRMLLTGAAIVRFANKFLDKFRKGKDFVLIAIYVWDNGEVTRFSLFQNLHDPRVHCKSATDSLNSSVGRAQFIRRLYNALHLPETEEETEDAIAKINQFDNKIRQHNNKYPMKSFHTEDTDRGATDCAELEARGYEVEPQEGVDESGCVWESLCKTPSHILIVYRPSNPRRKFIAKKVRKDSNELDTFRLLATFQPKSEHIISLHDSFKTRSTRWAILPKMSSIANIVSIAPKQLHGKVAQVCWGLIKGVAYLHKFNIAHRDIKPQNLVVDGYFCLKIIDFDVAMEVEDENEEVDGQCGTKGWLAPEMIEKSRYSPIKADRWSSGQVILCLLDQLSEEDAVLRTIASKLTVHDPNKRPSMLQVTPLPSDVVKVVQKKASRSLQDVEVDGEDRKPPEAKKQKLSVADLSCPDEVI